MQRAIPSAITLQKSPFNFDENLGVAVTGFLDRAISWMLGGGPEYKPPSELDFQLVPEVSSCWWGCALYVDVFVVAIRRYLLTGDRCEIGDDDRARLVLRRALGLVERLLRSRDVDHDGIDAATTCHWERVSYDTALIARALLSFVELVENENLDQIGGKSDIAPRLQRAVKEIRDITPSILRWLRYRAVRWEDVRYPAGPQDLAVILRLLVAVKKTFPELYPTGPILYVRSSVLRRAGRPSVTADIDKDRLQAGLSGLIEIVAARLVREAEDGVPLDLAYKADQHAVTTTASWGGAHTTAHVLLALSEACPTLTQETRGDTIEVIWRTVLHLEITQNEGNWGIPNETALTLLAYCAACRCLASAEASELQTVEEVPEILFRALRWLVDGNQRFSDGSILHLFTYTAFYAQTLQYLLDWKPRVLALTVADYYDYVVWTTLVSGSVERSKRLHLNGELIRYQGTIRRLIGPLNAARVLAVFVIVSAAVLLGQGFGWLVLFPADSTLASWVPTPQPLLGLAGLVVTGLTVFWRTTESYLKRIVEPSAEPRYRWWRRS